jgi:CRP-like cAMP-binding protein/small-conductance mechanosensitive channel
MLDPQGLVSALESVVERGGHRAATLIGACALVVVAFLVGRFSPQRRRHLRLAVSFFASYLMCVMMAGALSFGGAHAWSDRALSIATLLFHMLLIDLAAVSFFFLALPRAGLDLPDIARDLIVGIAYGVAFLALLNRFGVEVWGLFATSAVASILVGVSLQPTLANVFGGLALQLDGSIGEGDWVRLPDKTEGRVRQVRWRHTVIETRNHDTLIVPNAQLLQQNILILGRRDGEPVPHRMWVFFYVDQAVSPERVLDVVGETLRAMKIEGVASSPPPSVVCMDMAPDRRGALYYGVRYFLTDLSRDDPVTSAVRVRVFTALRRAGIALAESSHDVTVSKAGAGARAARQAQEDAARLALLDSVELFDAMTPEEKRLVARKLKPAPFCRGEVITRQGADAHWLYLLQSGSADITVALADGGERVVASVTAPTIFGEMGLLTGAPRSATVTATSPVDCLRLDKEVFREVLEARPEVAAELSEVLAERQRQVAEALHEEGSDRPHAQGGDESSRRILESVKRFFGLDDAGPRSIRR